MRDANDELVKRLRDAHGLNKLIGGAAAFRNAISLIPLAAESDATVLINGETGTGKELVARALHYLSDRAPFPFVAVNCGSLTDTLLEDELFGHERGAFTDAHQQRAGLIVQAHRGTLFFDELDTLTARGQVALLRVLQDKSFRPLGSANEQQADVRFLGATNAPLLEFVERGAFRADLYYRFCVFSIDLPPLRQRSDDVLLLARHFLAVHAPKDRRGLRLAADAEVALLACQWPGNVRQLESVMIRAARLCDGDIIGARHLGLPAAVRQAESSPRSAHLGLYKMLKAAAIRTFEQEYLTRLLEASEGNVTRAARVAGKDRRDLGRLLKKHKLDPRLFAKMRV